MGSLHGHNGLKRYLFQTMYFVVRLQSPYIQPYVGRSLCGRSLAILSFRVPRQPRPQEVPAVKMVAWYYARLGRDHVRASQPPVLS